MQQSRDSLQATSYVFNQLGPIATWELRSHDSESELVWGRAELSNGMMLQGAIKLILKILSKTMDSTALTAEKLELVTVTHDSNNDQVGTLSGRACSLDEASQTIGLSERWFLMRVVYLLND